MTTTSPPEIVWDAARNRFSTQDGLAYLQYTQDDGQRVIDLVHTYVPPSKRGTGVAAVLCKAAFQHAKDHNLRVIPTCTYISDNFLPHNPSWKDIVFTGIKPTL